MTIPAKELLQWIGKAPPDEALPPMIEKPYVFRVGRECMEGTCVHSKGTGYNCAHMHREGERYMEPLSFNKCDCAAVKEVDSTIPFIPSDIVRGHNYSNKYMPSHCCACGLIRGSKEICVPMPMFEVVQRVEHNIEVHTMVASRRYELEKPAAIVPQIYRGNLSPLYPVTWGLIGGPLAQRRRT